MNFSALSDVISSFQRIVLVANNESIDQTDLTTRFGHDTLYIFFNCCLPVLKSKFPGASILCRRIIDGQDPTIDKGGKLALCRERLGSELLAEIGLHCNNHVASTSNGPRDCPGFDYTIDFDHDIPSFYPPTHVPSTGFAALIWLMQKFPTKHICLFGFSGVAGHSLKVHHVHDWIFEQAIITALHQKRKIDVISITDDEPSASHFAAVTNLFPDLSPLDLMQAAQSSINRRVIANEERTAILWRSTRWMVTLRNIFRRLMGRKSQVH